MHPRPLLRAVGSGLWGLVGAGRAAQVGSRREAEGLARLGGWGCGVQGHGAPLQVVQHGVWMHLVHAIGGMGTLGGVLAHHVAHEDHGRGLAPHMPTRQWLPAIAQMPGELPGRCALQL